MSPGALSVRLGAAVAAALAGVAIGGCGATATINSYQLEKAIAISVAEQQHVISIVNCPSHVAAQKGNVFYCGVTLATGRTLPITVTVKDDHGNVHYSGFNGYVNGHPSSG